MITCRLEPIRQGDAGLQAARVHGRWKVQVAFTTSTFGFLRRRWQALQRRCGPAPWQATHHGLVAKRHLKHTVEAGAFASVVKWLQTHIEAKWQRLLMTLILMMING